MQLSDKVSFEIFFGKIGEIKFPKYHSDGTFRDFFPESFKKWIGLKLRGFFLLKNVKVHYVQFCIKIFRGSTHAGGKLFHHWNICDKFYQWNILIRDPFVISDGNGQKDRQMWILKWLFRISPGHEKWTDYRTRFGQRNKGILFFDFHTTIIFQAQNQLRNGSFPGTQYHRTDQVPYRTSPRS